MTCVVGVQGEVSVILGGDMASSGDNGELFLQAKADSKVFRCGAYVVGTSGSARYANVLRYVVKWPTAPRDSARLEDRDLLRFVIQKVVPAIQKVFTRAGLRRDEGHGDDDQGEALLGLRGRLFHLQDDFSIEMPRCGYWAIGSASGLALGALHAMKHGYYVPRELALAALRAGHAHSTEVRPPFSFVEGARDP